MVASPSMALASKEHTVADDVINDIAFSMLNITREEALDQIPNLIGSIDFTYFRLGGILSQVQNNGWYSASGYETFRDFVKGEYNMEYRKARYLMAIYVSLVESGVSWEKIKHLGWTKVSLLSPILNNVNVDSWVKIAEAATVLQLAEAVKLGKGTVAGINAKIEPPTNPVTTVTFRVHADQKEVIMSALSKMKADISTEFDSVALETICLSSLSEDPPVVLGDLHTVMGGSSWETVLSEFEKLWPEVDIQVTIPTE